MRYLNELVRLLGSGKPESEKIAAMREFEVADIEEFRSFMFGVALEDPSGAVAREAMSLCARWPRGPSFSTFLSLAIMTRPLEDSHLNGRFCSVLEELWSAEAEGLRVLVRSLQDSGEFRVLLSLLRISNQGGWPMPVAARARLEAQVQALPMRPEALYWTVASEKQLDERRVIAKILLEIQINMLFE